MPIPAQVQNLFGAFDSKHLDRPVNDFDQPDLYAAISLVLAQYSGLVTEVLSVLADTTTVAKERVPFGGMGGGMLQPSAELGRVLATRPRRGAFFDVGYPIGRFGDRAIFTAEWLLRNTLRDVAIKTTDAIIKDYETLMRYVLNAVFQNVNYDFNDDEVLGQNLGIVGVKRLLNADGTPGIAIVNGRQVPLATKNHYKVSGTAGYTDAAFILAYNALRDVGMSDDVVFFISEDDKDAVTALPSFISVDTRDRNIIYPAGTEPMTAIVRNPKAIGRIKDKGEVIPLQFLPAGYMAATDRNADRPAVIRESDLPQLRGFRLTDQDNEAAIDTNQTITSKFWSRIFGVGVRNRANMVIVQITTDAVYTPPNFGV